MAEKPILFSGAMVRAILAGRNPLIRRAVKIQPTTFPDQGPGLWHHVKGAKWESGLPYICPYGKPGGNIWVRETFALYGMEAEKPENRPIFYRADDDAKMGYHTPPDIKWKPSIHMPRWASRLTLEITHVKVERVQEITKEDCIAEGIAGLEDVHAGWHQPFAKLWDLAYIKRGFGWDKNPWVWAITFKRAEPTHAE